MGHWEAGGQGGERYRGWEHGREGDGRGADGRWQRDPRGGGWHESRGDTRRSAQEWGSQRNAPTNSPRGQPVDALPEPPPIPVYATIPTGATPNYSEFLTCLFKCARRWARCWAAWRNTRPAPPEKRRTYDPKLIPGEARLFVDVYRLHQAYAAWEQTTRDRPMAEEQRGTRRSREERRWEERDDRQARPRR